MPKVQDVLDALESIAPTSGAFSFDKVGLQVGNRHQEVSRAVVSLDRSHGAVEYTASRKGQLLLSHHPLIFDPLPKVTEDSNEGLTVRRLIQHDISFIAAHTNWDVAPGGINDALSSLLGLQDIKLFGSAATLDELKLVFFCPADSAEAVIDACSAAGAGVIGLYTRCAFYHEGTGTFRGGEGSNPTVGVAGSVERVNEVRVEMVCPSSVQSKVVAALVKAHPYEEPAFDFLQLAKRFAHPAGRLGVLPSPMKLSEFAQHVDKVLNTRCWTWGNADKVIKKVGVVGGAAEGDYKAAQKAGADAYVTGEVRQHVALEASERGFPMIAAGHYATENPGCGWLCRRMSELLPEIQWEHYEPAAGAWGRPF